ncbi:MAG: hypothetical protein HY741_00265 [Chloroflexi bacterium]|nr:hypothetical protein [Chloroflexota bacterium]
MQRLFVRLLKIFGPRFRLAPLVAEYLARAGRIGKTDQIPTELVPLAARLWARGWFNHNLFDSHRDWILPYWATRQLDPADPGFVARALNPVFLNTAYRNWTTIGNPESKLEAVVDPRGLVTPQPNGDGWSLDAWLRVDAEIFFPSRLDESSITQKPFENLPLVQTQYEPARLRLNQEAFAVQDNDGNDWLIAAYSIENPRGDARTATLFLSLRPFNPEGAALVDHPEWRAAKDSTELWVNDELAALLPPPNAFASSNAEAGDVAFQLDALNGASSIADRTGLATAAAAYELDLRAHTQRVVTVALPMSRTRASNAQAAQWTKPDALPQLKRDFRNRWRTLLAQAMTIRVPDDAIQNAFDANKAFLLLFHDGDSITAGPFLYHEFWFRDAAYMLNALSQLGYHAQVKQVLEKYPRRLRKDGYMLAQDGEWDANGQALWTLEQHTRLSGDFEVLHDQYWNLLNAAHWIDAARQKTKQNGERVPEYGLLPAGMSAEHLGPNDFYFWDDWWGLAGLRAAVLAAKLFNSPDDQAKLQKAYDAFLHDLNSALQHAAHTNDAAWMPASPYRRADSAMVSNLAASYPLQLVPPNDVRITATIDELKRRAFVDGAFFHHVGHGGFGTYLALHIAGSEIFQRKPEAWNAMRFLLKHASPTWTWGEAIHPNTRRGGHGDGHHGWMAADLISFIRNALLFEENDHLVLTPALPDEWVFETASIKVERAATYFGDVDFTLAFGDRNATLVLKGKWREPPMYIEWNLPMEIKNAGGDKEGVELMDAHRVRIPSNVTRVVATF